MSKVTGEHTHPQTGRVYTYAGSAFLESRDKQQQLVMHWRFAIHEAGMLVLEQTKAFVFVDPSKASSLAADWARALIEMTFAECKPLDRCCSVEGTEVRDTGTPKGRGVFATRAFAEGELVETARVILDGQGFDRFVFNYSAAMGLGSTKVHQASIALGNGSLYNGANPANMRFEADVKAQAIRFIAARDITSGEELTVNYSAQDGGPISADNWWFDRKQLKMLP
ncbi:MAG TPA: SET domain-containing protein-lysine N-methyltransferase [Methylibium sp.]|nr:SET domain-containing protein-lysine N-methyltransferase [Methylibium sp.]